MSLATARMGDTVILHMFTGVAVGVKEIVDADKETVTLETRVGTAKFSRKSGKQIEPKAKNERFANYITEDDGSFVPPKKKAALKPKPEKNKEDMPKPRKKKKKTSSKPKKKPEPEDINESEYIEEEI